MDPVEAYLAGLSAIRSSGAAVPETSGYGALATLLNAVGHTLKPKVRCLINLANTGAPRRPATPPRWRAASPPS